MTEQKIIYTDWGVANVFSDGTIELHKDLQLPEYELLRAKILDHELDHDYKKGFWHNLKVDLFHTVGIFGLLNFMIRRPKTWLQFSPISWSKTRGIVYDVNLFISWFIILFGVIAMIIARSYISQ